MIKHLEMIPAPTSSIDVVRLRTLEFYGGHLSPKTESAALNVDVISGITFETIPKDLSPKTKPADSNFISFSGRLFIDVTIPPKDSSVPKTIPAATISSDVFTFELMYGWSDKKNDRRCQLVDKEIEGTLSPAEERELDQLQNEMLAYRRQVAPLPLDEVRELHQKLLREAAQQND